MFGLLESDPQNSVVNTVKNPPNQNTPTVKILKAHADTLASKAASYYCAKSRPRNFCKAIEDVQEGRELLQAFDEAVDEGMDPGEGSNLITKCAGSMGTAMSGPLAATLATRPVKNLADATVMGGEERAVAKSWVPAHERHLDTGKIIEIPGHNTKVVAQQHDAPKGGKKVGHYAVQDGKTKWTEGEAHEGTVHATLAQRTALGVNKNKGFYLRAANKADAKAIQEAIYKVTGDHMEAKQGGANHHGNDSAFPHFFLGLPANRVLRSSLGAAA